MEKLDERRIEAGSVITYGGVEVLLVNATYVFSREEDKEAIDRAMNAPRRAAAGEPVYRWPGNGNSWIGV